MVHKINYSRVDKLFGNLFHKMNWLLFFHLIIKLPWNDFHNSILDRHKNIPVARDSIRYLHHMFTVDGIVIVHHQILGA